MVPGGLPYQPWARAERIDRTEPHRGYDDPTAHCFVAGVPRSQYVPAPDDALPLRSTEAAQVLGISGYGVVASSDAIIELLSTF